MCKSTDVPGSIAGYYYQILLACRELTSGDTSIEEIGIEAGADVRIIKHGGARGSIEAKFHKKNMSRYDKEIVKTIYNFYSNSRTDSTLEFSTNVAPTRDHKEFFEMWNKDNALSEDEKNTYVLKCLFRYCCKHVNPYKSEFEKYELDKGDKEKNCLKALQEEIFGEQIDTEKLKKYCFEDNINLDKEFSKKLMFTFGDNDKLCTINDLKDNINSNILRICKERGIDIDDNGVYKIRNLLLDKFFMVVSENAIIGSNASFSEIKKFSKSDLEYCIENYNEEVLRFLENIKIKNLINAIEKEEENFIKLVNDNNYEQAEELIQLHSDINQLFLQEIVNIKDYEKFISIYTLKNQDSFEVIFKLINQLTIIAFYKGKVIDDISFFKSSNECLENVFINELIDYSFKACPTSYSDFEDIFKLFYDETNKNYSITPGEIVTFAADFGKDCCPCEVESEDVFNNVLDISETGERLENEIALYKSIQYRCNRCAVLRKKENKTIISVEEFLSCKGCK